MVGCGSAVAILPHELRRLHGRRQYVVRRGSSKTYTSMSWVAENVGKRVVLLALLDTLCVRPFEGSRPAEPCGVLLTTARRISERDRHGDRIRFLGNSKYVYAAQSLKVATSICYCGPTQGARRSAAERAGEASRVRSYSKVCGFAFSNVSWRRGPISVQCCQVGAPRRTMSTGSTPLLGSIFECEMTRSLTPLLSVALNVPSA